jgi:hypothetical protein
VSVAPTDPPGSPEPTALPRDVTLFLVQFAVALNKSRAYPPSHPILVAAVDLLVQHLGVLLKARSQLTIGVTRHQVIIDGVASEDHHPILRDLAERLHHHQVAALQVRPGITADEVADLLGALAAETWRQGRPLSLEPLDTLAGRWPHATVEALPLDQLELGDGDSAAVDREADQLWRGLAQAALLTANEAAGGAAEGRPDGAQVAKAMRSRRGDAQYGRQVVDWLMEVGDKFEKLDEDSPARQAITRMFGELDRETLTNLMQLGATREQRRRLVHRGARTLPVKAVLDLLDAAATTSDKSLSQSFLRLLGKLADHVDPSRGPVVVGAESVLRDSVRQLVGEWDDPDPTAHSHRELLDLLSEPGARSPGTLSGRVESGSLRVIQMALELGVRTPEVELAALDVCRSTPLAEVLALLDAGRDAGLDVTVLWAAVGRPEYFSGRLLDESEEHALLERVLDHLGDDGIDPMLEALELADSASRRRWLITRLEAFGATISPRLVPRLAGKPWYIQRNLLVLLGTLGLPPGFDPEPFTHHEDLRVRREAYKLLFAGTGQRASAILRAAADPDPAIARLALAAAAEQCPPDLPVKLVEYLRGAYRDPDLRVAAIRLLGKRPSPVVRDWLLHQVVVESGLAWFRRARLREKSADLLAALGVIAASYAQHPRAETALRLARASRDPDIRAVARAVVAHE